MRRYILAALAVASASALRLHTQAEETKACALGYVQCNDNYKKCVPAEEKKECEGPDVIKGLADSE